MITIDLSLNNAYQNARLIELPGGDPLLFRDKLTLPIGTGGDQYHTVMNSDRLDTIAWRYYRYAVRDASKFWWVIADVNGIFNPLDLSEFVGKEIRIPDINKALLHL